MPVQGVRQPLTLALIQGLGQIQPLDAGSQNITEWNNVGHNYLIMSGAKMLGKNSTISGNTMMASKTTNMGINMIMVSLMA